MTDSIDGNEKAYFKTELTSFPHYDSRLLLAGEFAFAIDKVIASKMGYKQSELPILDYEGKQCLDYQITPELISGGDLTPFPNWKKVESTHVLLMKMQTIPVTDDLIARGIRMYKFPILEKQQKT